ncbi:response regulator transcription factor [bacterium]|nr:response regulator transcription factor [bacterium]MDC0275954.1 response regulator transcription factor [Verrucomicrobiales bacterium]
MKLENKISLMLVDDHFVVRSGLAASLELEEDIEVIAEAASGEEAVFLFLEKRPDVVLMDLQLPGINGIEATEKILLQDRGARVLIFSTFVRDDEIQTALEVGALGYLQKSASREELLSAIRATAIGETVLPENIAKRLKGLQSGPTITVRECEVLVLIAQGKANKEIADVLGNAEDTVKRHISNIFKKFGVNDRAQATAEAIRRGIVKV